jgi:hypothetical protein
VRACVLCVNASEEACCFSPILTTLSALAKQPAERRRCISVVPWTALRTLESHPFCALDRNSELMAEDQAQKTTNWELRVSSSWTCAVMETLVLENGSELPLNKVRLAASAELVALSSVCSTNRARGIALWWSAHAVSK